jgi:hypothetical protein
MTLVWLNGITRDHWYFMPIIGISCRSYLKGRLSYSTCGCRVSNKICCSSPAGLWYSMVNGVSSAGAFRGRLLNCGSGYSRLVLQVAARSRSFVGSVSKARYALLIAARYSVAEAPQYFQHIQRRRIFNLAPLYATLQPLHPHSCAWR